MSEYIEREAVNALIKAECSPKVAAYLIDAVAAITAADVRPVVRGKWVYQGNENFPYCSECMMPQDMPTDFCPSCGADMREGLTMYEELVKRLRCQRFGNCPNCAMRYTEEVEPNLWRERCAAIDAADAIEELVGFVQEAERDRDEYRERLDKANDAIDELRDALLLMVLQYCTTDDGLLYHSFMSAGENAFAVLGLENGQQADPLWDRVLIQKPPKEET